MKKTLLTIISTLAISAVSFSQLDLAVTQIANPVADSVFTPGDDIIFKFNVNVAAGSIVGADTDTLVFTITIPGLAQPYLVSAPIAQDIPTGATFQLITSPLSTTGANSGVINICIDYVGIYTGLTTLPTPDANANNNQTCSNYNEAVVPTAIKEHNAVNSLFLSNSQLIYDVKSNKAITFNIYNTSGQLVKTETTSNTSGSINFSDLNNGVYFVNVQTEGKVITKKIAKF